MYYIYGFEEKSIFDKQGLKYFECSALNYESLK